MAKKRSCKKDELPFLAARVIEGLRDNALKVAMKIGLEALESDDGVEIDARILQTIPDHCPELKSNRGESLYRALFGLVQSC